MDFKYIIEEINGLGHNVKGHFGLHKPIIK